MQKLDGKVTELEQLDSDDLDFSNNFKESDFLFFQTLPKTDLNPGFVFLVQSVLESLRRNDKIHFLFYQNISYANWRKLFRHFFLRLYKREKENESDIKFVFGVPYKLFNGLDTKLEIPEDLIVGEWRDITGTRDIFGSGLSVSQSQDFLYITNDPETPIPRGVRKNSRKRVLVQYSSELVPFVQELYPSKRRNKKFPMELMGGKIEATNTKVMMTSQLPSDLTTPTWFSSLERSQITTLSGARNVRGGVFLKDFYRHHLIQNEIKFWADKKNPKIYQIIRNLKGSASFGFGSKVDLNDDWFLKLDFLKRGHTAQAINDLRAFVERQGIGLEQQDRSKNAFSLNVPFLPKAFYVIRRQNSLIISSTEDLKISDSEISIRKSFFAVDVNLELYRAWLSERWMQLARHYHVRALKRCTKYRLGRARRDFCPLGPSFNNLVCPVHGALDEPSVSKALDEDKRFMIFEDFLNRFDKFLFTLSFRDKSLELEFEIN